MRTEEELSLSLCELNIVSVDKKLNKIKMSLCKIVSLNLTIYVYLD